MEAAGDLTEKTDTATGETTHYHYYIFGKLRTVDVPDGRQIEYLVDGRNRRVGSAWTANWCRDFSTRTP